MRFTPEQADMDKFFAMLATSKQPELRALANDYKRSKQKTAFDSKPCTKEEVIAILKSDILRKPPHEREAIMEYGEKIVEQIYADEERREQAEQNALAERMYLTRRTVMNQWLRR